MAEPPVPAAAPSTPKKAGVNKWLAGQFLVIWPLVASAAVVTPSVLLNKRTEVDIQLVLNRVSFRVKNPLQAGLFGSVPARSLTVVSFGSIDLGPGRFERAQGDEPNAPAGPVRLVGSDPLARATIDDVTVQEIRVPGGATLTMEWEAADPPAQALSVRADRGLSARLSARSGQPLAIRACVGCQIEGVSVSAASILAQPARFVAATDQLMSLSSATSPASGLGMTMRLELGAGSALAETVIPVPDGIDTTMSEGAARVSAVAGGTIKYPAFTLPPRELKPGDVIVLGDIPDLRILSLQIDKGILVRLHGRATHVSTGPPGFVADTVPSWFQWYMSSLFPYVHATIALAAVALATFQKLRSAPAGERRA